MKPTKLLLLLASLSAGLSILIAQQPAPPDAAAGGAAATAAAPATPAAAGSDTQPAAPAAAAPAAPAPAAIEDPVLRRLAEKAAEERGADPSTVTVPSTAMEPFSPGPGSSEPITLSPGETPSTEPSDLISDTDSTAPPGDRLTMNFVNAPLDRVLNYMSEAAGFVIVKEVQPRGYVNIVSKRPIGKDEAVKLLHSALLKNGCGAIKTGRTLTIVSAEEMKVRGIPVMLWNGDPESIPQDDVTVTEILPVRFVQVAELMQNVIPLVNPSTPLTANQSGNSLIITDTQNNIRRIAEIIKAVDAGAEDVTVVEYFKLTYANPSEVADEVTTLYGNRSQSGGLGAAMTPMVAGGRGGRGGAGGTAGRARTRNTTVVAVPDMRTGGVVVTASQDLMDSIKNTVSELDAEKALNQTVYTFKLDNVEPAEAMQVLQDIFQKSGTTSRNNNTQNNALLNRSTSNNQSYGSTSRSGSGMGGGGMGGGGRTGGGGMGGGRTSGMGGMSFGG